MNTRDKITALKAGDTGPALVGSKYEGATEGVWENNYDPHDDIQTECFVGVPIQGWGYFANVCEMSTFQPEGENKQEQADLALVTDAKHNAALCAVQREVIADQSGVIEKLLTHLKSNFHDDSSVWVKEAQDALDLAKQLEDL